MYNSQLPHASFDPSCIAEDSDIEEVPFVDMFGPPHVASAAAIAPSASSGADSHGDIARVFGIVIPIPRLNSGDMAPAMLRAPKAENLLPQPKQLPIQGKTRSTQAVEPSSSYLVKGIEQQQLC